MVQYTHIQHSNILNLDSELYCSRLVCLTWFAHLGPLLLWRVQSPDDQPVHTESSSIVKLRSTFVCSFLQRNYICSKPAFLLKRNCLVPNLPSLRPDHHKIWETRPCRYWLLLYYSEKIGHNNLLHTSITNPKYKCILQPISCSSACWVYKS